MLLQENLQVLDVGLAQSSEASVRESSLFFCFFLAENDSMPFDDLFGNKLRPNKLFDYSARKLKCNQPSESTDEND